MNNTELIKELRALTQAGMKDCRDALNESGWDLQAAIDVIKAKNLNVVSDRGSKIAAEGLVDVTFWKTNNCLVMAEVNCQTDFTANSPEFKEFTKYTIQHICLSLECNTPFDPKVSSLESKRQELVSKTKENIVVRRWWVEEVFDETASTFSYVHSNNKIGVIITVKAETKEVAKSPDFAKFSVELAMQIAAMNPMSVSIDKLPTDEVARQRAIFETQLTDLKKPQAAWPKIMDGKFSKWHREVCLLEQESIIVPNTTVKQLIKDMENKFGTSIEVVNFIRCQVGEGLEKKQENFADEVAKLV